MKSILPPRQQRLDAKQLDRNEIANIAAELRIRNSLSSIVLQNAELVVKVGGLVCVIRETDKR